MPALRRTAFAALAAALALTYGPSAGAQTVVVGPRAIGVSTAANGLVTVPVVADMTASGGASLGSLTGRLTWRPAVARLVDATAGNAGPVALNPDTTLGQLQFAVANAAGATGTPVLVNVTLQALGAPNDTTLLGLSLSEITAAGTFADLLPITTVTSALFCIAGGRYGDIDGNDSLRSNDALFIVTQAVGLAIPYPTFNGDVDNDGKVDTRDALLVLSYVVGLPTAPYRVGQLNTGGCAVRGAASIAIQPAPPGLVVGDQFPLGVVAFDSSGAITNTLGLAWVSRDPTVATVDSAGRLTAVATGTTRVVVIAAPGLMDSATVDVTSVRHTWWVDAVTAAGQAVELGSQTQPFATIQPAVNRAAAGDTVRVGVSLYGGAVVIKKSLVVIGDSTAAGFPRLRNGTGPGVVVDTAGTVRLSRLQIEDSQGGVIAVDVDTLALSGIVVARSRGVGIRVRNSGYAAISGSSVGGAVFRGIDAESTATLQLRRTTVDLIAEGVGGAPALALRAFVVDTVVADTVSLLTAGARVDSADVVSFREVVIDGAIGGLGVPVVKFSGVGSVRIAQSRFAQNGYGQVLIEDTPGGAATASVDTSTFDDTNLKVFGLASFAMRGGQVLDGYNAAVDVDSTDVVSLVGSEIASTQVGGGPEPPTSGGPWAVTVAAADSLRADSLWIHDNLAGALGALNVTAVSAYGNLLEANALAYGAYGVKLYQPQRARIAQTVIDESGGLASRSLDVVYGFAGGASVVVDTSTFLGPYYGVYAPGLSAGYNDTLVVRGSRMQSLDVTGGTYISVYAPYLGHVGVVGNTLDTTYYGVYAPYSGSAEVRNNVIRNVRYYGVYLYSTPQGVSVSGNTIECTPGYYSGSQGITVQYAPPVVTANTVRYCSAGIDVENYSGIPYAAEVRGNVVVGDTVYGSIGIELNGQYTRPVLALNDVSAGRFSTAALRLFGSTIDSARVDSNTVRDGLGPAIQTSGSVVGVSIRGNVVERFQGLTAGTGEGGIAITHTGGGATVVNNRVSFATSMPGVQLYQAGGTITLDSNVVVDGGLNGVQLTGLAVTVTGSRNFVARNYRGFYGTTGTVTIGQSTIQGNTFRGADGVAAWNLANDYWGDALGPRCVTGCDPGSVGDSVVGVGTFLPFLAVPDVATPVGAPPAIRPAAARTAAVGAALLRTVAGATRAVRPSRALPVRVASPAALDARRRLAEAERVRLVTPPGERRP